WSDSCFLIVYNKLLTMHCSYCSAMCTNIVHDRACLEPEFLAQIESAHIGVVDDVVGATLHQHFPRIDDVGAVGQAQRLAHVMIGDQHADAAIGEMPHQRLDVADGDRVDAGERLVEQH